ncbi:sulfatase-like hydrolase/transferase [uncultured Shimia sp.]|uniref:sulfatase-like hydrolase/transferase n=1 Tax=uncultured Shimia sp. TaxID=573152 RepID=UPI002636A6D2|nr:sulfatase-like hydrolase/transferase [uncultured Shimia sp.]
MYWRVVAFLSLLLPTVVAAQEPPIIHDAEHYILLNQHAERWQQEDTEISEKLASIRDANGGKAPNIVYILLDDLGFGEIGMPNLDVIRGYSTPNISGFAEQGLSFMRMYTEPSCTPTRAAMMTGRYAIRTGTTEAKSVVSGDGLSAWEVTLAEVLSEGGYKTVHMGKWHLGDIEESYAFNQGFDYAEHPVHQQGQMAIMNADAEQEGISTGLSQTARTNTYELDKSFRLNPHAMVYGIVGEKGGASREVNFEAGEIYTQAHYQRMEEDYKNGVLEQLEQLAGSNQPFFLNYWPQLPISLTRGDIDGAQTLNGGPMAESLATVDTWIGEILSKLDELGIAENTIVIVMGDNGPFMQYREYSGQNDRIYRGGKTDHLEGGVRVNAFMRWPAGIEAGGRVQDIVHVTDLFTTLARLADSDDHIPRDRLIDGVDQTPLLFVGDSHGRRDYVFIYEGPVLRSIVKQQFKFHLPTPGANPIAAPVFDLYKDSREERIDTAKTITLGVGFGGPFVGMMKRHLGWKQKYPDREQGHGVPYGGIENLRPETQALVDGFAMMGQLMGKE